MKIIKKLKREFLIFTSHKKQKHHTKHIMKESVAGKNSQPKFVGLTSVRDTNPLCPDVSKGTLC